MDNERSRTHWRAVADTILALAATAGFVATWTVPHLSEGTRRLAAFGLALALVVFWNEAARSWADRGSGRREAR